MTSESLLDFEQTETEQLSTDLFEEETSATDVELPSEMTQESLLDFERTETDFERISDAIEDLLELPEAETTNLENLLDLDVDGTSIDAENAESATEMIGEFDETLFESVDEQSTDSDGIFGELETSLGLEIEENSELTHSQIIQSVDFEELEALLGDEEPLSDLNRSASQVVFDRLEAFLNEAPAVLPQIEAPSTSSPTSPEVIGIDKVTESQGSPGASDAADADFDELEKLLADADKTLGGPPTVTTSRRQAQLTLRRPKVAIEHNMKVPIKQLDNLSNLVGELVVNRNTLEQDQERLRLFLDNLLFQVQQLSDVGQRMRDLYERSLLESALLNTRTGNRFSARSNETQSEQNFGLGELELDRNFTRFHELAQDMIELIVRVRESASDIEFIVDETDQVTRQFRQVTTQLQEGLTRSRMVPFAQTADRLPGAVRRIADQLNKQAQIYIEGKETLIDKMIQEQLFDPMTHLINNAMTHGIEVPKVRAASGKPPVGRIDVHVFHQGNQTVISVKDDGAGIDPQRVKAKAIEKGLITQEESQTMSRLDVYDLLFHPGFSTKDRADNFSGRGVGMDVVRVALRDIRGTIHTDSELGKGTTFTIRMPLTLSISKALCCISNWARIAFPMDGVEDMLDVPRERIQTNEEGQSCIMWRDTLLPFRPLSELLQYNRQIGRARVFGGNQEDDITSIVVLRSAGQYIALQVDQVIGEQEIVIKQLEGPVPKPIGVAGATVLGDGRIMPIADVLELIDLSMGRSPRPVSPWKEEPIQMIPETAAVKSEPTVLIVDDSITVRELLSMSFNKAGYRVEQARDGQDAWDKLRSGLPCDIIFCDIEMPKMNGLELLERLQKDSALKELPMAMLTSRGAEKYQKLAASMGAKGYFTKPYLEEALLEAAQKMLKGENLVLAKA